MFAKSACSGHIKLLSSISIIIMLAALTCTRSLGRGIPRLRGGESKRLAVHSEVLSLQPSRQSLSHEKPHVYVLTVRMREEKSREETSQFPVDGTNSAVDPPDTSGESVGEGVASTAGAGVETVDGTIESAASGLIAFEGHSTRSKRKHRGGEHKPPA